WKAGEVRKLMEGPRTQDEQGTTRRDLGLLAILAVCAAAIHFWIVFHTEVASRDSIGYIRFAWQLEHQPWKQAIRHADQHPGYPRAILTPSLVVRTLTPAPFAVVMQLSAQLASALASVLLVVPMFYLGRELFDRRVGFWTSLLFQCLPATSRVLAD